MKFKYMHTINGYPATYEDGEQIVFVFGKRNPIKLVDSLRQIKSEQIKTKKWRDKQGFSIIDSQKSDTYSYVKVLI